MITKYEGLIEDIEAYGICNSCIHKNDDTDCIGHPGKGTSCSFHWKRDNQPGWLTDEKSLEQYKNAVWEIRESVGEEDCSTCQRQNSEYCESCCQNSTNLPDTSAEAVEPIKEKQKEKPLKQKAKRDIWKTTKIAVTAAGLICAVVTTVAMLNKNGDLAYRTGTCFWLMMCGELILKLVEETE